MYQFSHVSHRRWLTHGIALLLFCMLSYYFFGRGVFDSSQHIFGDGGDSILFYWFFQWWNYSVAQHSLPLFLSHAVWAPDGYNLTQATSVIGAWVLTLPLQLFMSPCQAMNVCAVAAPGLSAWTMYLLCFELTRKFFPALLSGWLFGFSSYMLAHTLGHLNLTAGVFILPLLVLLVVKFNKGTVSNVRFCIFFSLLFVLLFYISLEVAFGFTLFGSIGLLLARYQLSGQGFSFKKVFYALFIAYCIALIFSSPYLYYFFSIKTLQEIQLGAQGNNLLELIIPNKIYLIKNSWTLQVARYFKYQGVAEQNGYLTLPLVMAVIIYAWRYWATAIGKYLIIFLIIIFSFSLGGAIYFGSTKLFNDPLVLGLHKFPLVKSLLLARSALYVEFVISIMMAYWLNKVNKYYGVKLLAIIFSVVLFLPAVNNRKDYPRYFSVEPAKFFQEKTYQAYLSPGDNIIYISKKSNRGLYYQAMTNFYFNLAVSYFGRPPSFISGEAYSALVDNHPDRLSVDQLITTIILSRKVDAVLVEDNAYPEWQALLSQVPAKIEHVGGVWVFRF